MVQCEGHRLTIISYLGEDQCFRLFIPSPGFMKATNIMEGHLLYELKCLFNLLLKHTYSHVESEVAQSCSTLCDLMDCSPPGSSIRGIF